MNNALADTILRIVGRFNSVRPYDWLGRLETMQYWKRQELEAWQAGELASIVEHAVSSVPYYRERISENELKAVRRDPKALSELPVLTKDCVRENFDQLQAPEYSQRPKQDVSTSGSTGKPLRIVTNNEAFGRYFAAKFRALRWYGVNFADRQLRVWGLMFRKDKRVYWKARDLLQNRMRISSLDLSDATLERSFEPVRRFQPVYINGYTSAIQRLADFIEQTRKDGRSLGVRLVVPTAEMLYDWQRQQIERVFGCPVMNEYGGSEVMAIAYQCPAGSMHISHENCIVEVLDDRNRPVPPGTEGLLTVTSLCTRAMPLIRYQNGDLVTRTEDLECSCGRQPGLFGLARIVGRSTDVLLRADGQPTHWTTMYYAIKDAFVPGMILEHQARQKTVTHIEILVIKGPLYDQASMDRFLQRMRETLGTNMRLDVKFVSEIPREASGKHRYFVSEIAWAQQVEHALPTH